MDTALARGGTSARCSEGADTTPGVAAEVYAATKSARYARKHNFVPCTVETGGQGQPRRHPDPPPVVGRG